jgi:hypothetical protein
MMGASQHNPPPPTHTHTHTQLVPVNVLFLGVRCACKCSKRANYGSPLTKMPLFCGPHRRPGDIDLRNRRCQVRLLCGEGGGGKPGLGSRE